MDDRVITNDELREDSYQSSIRPKMLSEYVGQSEIKENLEVFIKASKLRHEPLDHV